jgi:MFS family permease
LSEAAVDIPQPVSYYALVRDNRDFRYLWFGQIISLLGDWFNLIASASLVGLLTQSGLAVGGLFVVRMLAPFLVSPVAGVAADRFNRKWLLIITDLSRALTVLGFLLVREPEEIWLLYTLTAIQLGLSGFFFPARNAILPDIVSKEELGAANALSSATWSIMLALGAALGGLAAGKWGIYPSFVIDGLTFLLSAVFIFQVGYTQSTAMDAVSKSLRAALTQYLDGLRYLKKYRDIFVIALLKAFMALSVSGAFQVIQVRLAEREFVIGEGGGTSLGLMYAAVGIGTGLGPIFARWFTGDRERKLRMAIALSYLIAASGLVVIGTLVNFGVVLGGTLLRGVGAGINWVFSTQLLLQILPERIRGRVFSTEFALLTLMNAAGAALGGWALDTPSMEVSTILWVMAALTLVLGMLWTVWLISRSREAPNSQK